jgi:hypothetical protein
VRETIAGGLRDADGPYAQPALADEMDRIRPVEGVE